MGSERCREDAMGPWARQTTESARSPVSVARKELTGLLSPSNSTLPKNRGGGGVTVNQKSDKEGGSAQELSHREQLFLFVAGRI